MAQLTHNYVVEVGDTPVLISGGPDPEVPVEERKAVVIRNVGSTILFITGASGEDPEEGLPFLPNEVLSDTVGMGDLLATCPHGPGGTVAVSWVTSS